MEKKGGGPGLNVVAKKKLYDITVKNYDFIIFIK